jgi:thiamine pyrophosphate-dependent acetolactate synthase large subunit-like protein
LKSLIDWGVDVVFGIPGDGVNGVIEAFRKHRSEIRFIQARHEEAAAFAACGYAKYTGKLGECLADRLGAVIVKALLGKAAAPDDSPFTTGQIGLLGTEPSQNALKSCDMPAIRRRSTSPSLARLAAGLASRFARPGTAARSFDEALRTPDPVIVNAIVDPHEPSMPPKIKASQIKAFAKALARGTPARGRIALTVASDTIRELL